MSFNGIEFFFLASGSKDGRVVVWNLKGETPERPRILPRLVNLDAIKDVAFSSDGRLLAAVDCAGKLVVWQMLVRPAGPW